MEPLEEGGSSSSDDSLRASHLPTQTSPNQGAAMTCRVQVEFEQSSPDSKSNHLHCYRYRVYVKMPLRSVSFVAEPELQSEDEDLEDAELSDESEGESEDIPNVGVTPKSRSKGLGKAMSKVEGSKIIVQTAFDAYFTYNKPGRVQTSSNVYNQLVIPLSAEEFSDAIGAKFKGPPAIQPSILSEENRELIFSRFMCELNEGFNILCYGVGSKRRLLNQFATTHCSKHGHVVVANGFQPDFVLKDLLCSIEDVPGLWDEDLPQLPSRSKLAESTMLSRNPLKPSLFTSLSITSMQHLFELQRPSLFYHC